MTFLLEGLFGSLGDKNSLLTCRLTKGFVFLNIPSKPSLTKPYPLLAHQIGPTLNQKTSLGKLSLLKSSLASILGLMKTTTPWPHRTSCPGKGMNITLLLYKSQSDKGPALSGQNYIGGTLKNTKLLEHKTQPQNSIQYRS